MHVPYISGEWKLLFKPEKHGSYVNDHSIIKANDGLWHLFGITSFKSNSYNEKYFVHASGENLDEPMKEEGRAIDRGTLAWSPSVIERDGYYYMFYGPSPTQLAVSFELTEWFNYPVKLKNEPLMAAHRDHFVFRHKDEYLMYVSGIHNKKGAISLFTSKDLINWEFDGFALASGESAPLHCPWGAMESPYVVEKDGLYYLFITYTDCEPNNYFNTLVFVSENPKRFGEYNGGDSGAVPITTLHAHASEIIKSEDGSYYITTCGWQGFALPHEGAVSIARLDWKQI